MKKLPIVLTLAGGLGNQLFQLSAGIYIQKITQHKIILNTCNLKFLPKSEPGNYSRSLGISELIKDFDTISTKFPIRLDSPRRLFRRIWDPSSIIQENNSPLNSIAKISDSTISIYGYFQDARIVESSWIDLRNKMANSSDFQKLVDGVKKKQIAVHLRFGDYSDDLATKAVHGLTDKSYFQSAIRQQLCEIGEDAEIIFVTDNLVEAQFLAEKISIGRNYTFVSNFNPIDDLQILSESSNLVITNSTFSWWGAWIASKIHDSKIIYPRPWFASRSDPDLPIFVKGWLPLKRKFATQ